MNAAEESPVNSVPARSMSAVAKAIYSPLEVLEIK